MPGHDTMQDRVNDLVIKFANVNGTGSASANALIMKAIFRLGVPVFGKNFFPSNIQGLPTWYEIRVTRDGWVARSGRVDLMVAMNSETYARDVLELSPGGCLLYDSSWPRPALLRRKDVTVLGAPLARMCNENFEGARARILMKNIMYTGVIAALLDIDLEVMRGLLRETFARKPALVDDNIRAIARIQLKYLAARLTKMEYGFEVSDAAVAEIAKAGFDPVYGARPLKRAIQSQIENPLAKAILEGRFAPRDTIRVDYRRSKMAFEKEPVKAAA